MTFANKPIVKLFLTGMLFCLLSTATLRAEDHGACLQFVHTHKDALRADLDKLMDRACIESGKAPEQTGWWYLARQCCDLNTIVGHYCEREHLAVANLSDADRERIGEKCVRALIGLAVSRESTVSRLNREDAMKACDAALGGK